MANLRGSVTKVTQTCQGHVAVRGSLRSCFLKSLLEHREKGWKEGLPMLWTWRGGERWKLGLVLNPCWWK